MTALAALCAAVPLLGLVFFFVNRRAFPPLPAEVEGPRPRVSILIPARNEARAIERAVRSHLDSDYPEIEVVVAEDNSTDATPEILARLSAEDPRVRVISVEEPPPGWLGKPHALWRAARAATGAWLLFVDADVIYAPSALSRAVSLAQREGLALLCLLSRFRTRGFWEGVLMPWLPAAVYLGPGFLLNSPRYRRGALGAGSGNLVRRDAYDRCGGHEALKSAVVDDVGLASRLKREGFATRAVTAYREVEVRMYEGFGEFVEGFSKNVGFLFDDPWRMFAFCPAALLLTWFPLGVLAARRAPDGAFGLSIAAVLLTVAARLLTSLETRTVWWSGLFHPVTATVWCLVGMRSAWRRRGGSVTWRGRTRPGT